MNGAHWKARFAAFWGAQAVSLFGSSLAQFALVWWLTEATQSATVLALSTLAALLPGILVGPFAGVFVDRWDRKKIIALSDTLGALVALALAILYLTQLIQPWLVVLAMFIRSLAGAFQQPAVQATTALIVPQEELSRVSGLNQMLSGLMQIAAPPLGALLMTLVPLEAIMAMDVVTAAVAVGLVLVLDLPRLAAKHTESAASVLHDLGEGFRYIWGWPALLGILMVSALLNLLLTPAFSLLPIFVTNHMHGGAEDLAWLNMAFGVGVVLGGLLLSVWGGFRRRIYTGALGVAGMGVAILALGFAPAGMLPLAIGAMLVTGSMNAFSNGPIMAMLQSLVAPEMQGRVFAVVSSVCMAMSPLGLLVGGPLADALGVSTLYLVGGTACLIMGVVIVLHPVLRAVEDGRQAAAQAA